MLAVLVGCDQGSKIYVEQNIPLYHSIEVWKNFFHITHVRNTGVAFGFLAGPDSVVLPILFALISMLAIGFIGYLYVVTPEGRMEQWVALALLLSGALGNLIDRLRLGEVIDFLDIHWYALHWPAFNVADSCITVGIGLLVAFSLHHEQQT